MFYFNRKINMKLYFFIIIQLCAIKIANTNSQQIQLHPHKMETFMLSNKTQANINIDPKIVGGTRAKLEGNEFMVSIRIKSKESSDGFGAGHLCGGSLITPSRVLSAAHCFFWSKGQIKFMASQLTVVMGVLDRTNYTGAVQRDVREIIVHRQYNPSTFENDIGLLNLLKSYSVNNIIKTINFANSSNLRTGQTAIISGWGTIIKDGPSSRYLLTTDVKVYDHMICRVIYEDINRITDTMFCAFEKGKDSCQGDSGGPLVVNGIQYGIVSWGYGCANLYYPGIYTNVPMYKDWILRGSTNKITLAKSFYLFVLIFIYFIF